MRNINETIFRAYDIRGLYPQEINKKIAFLIGRALADFLGAKKVVVARDTRYSSKKLMKHFIKGLLRQGVNVVNIGLASSPVLFSRAFKQGIDAGIITTASHNPPGYNGFKILRSNSEMIGAETGLKEVYKIIKDNSFKEIEKKGKLTNEKNAIRGYIQEIIKSFPFFEKLESFKIAVDAAGGSGKGVIEELFQHLKSRLIGLEFRPQWFPWYRVGLFDPEDIPNPLILKTIEDLSGKIRSKKCDIGFALDGDADRIIVLDEKGEFIAPDLITALLAREILKENKGAKIAYEVRSSRILAEIIRENKGTPIKMPVGSALIKKRMRKENMVFGGEGSGHYFFQETFYAESTVLVILLILKILTLEQKPFSEIIKPFMKYSKSGEINFEVKNKEKIFEIIKEKYKDAQISFIDGITIEYPEWWFNLRKSNTEPLFRLNFEAKNKDVFKKRLEEVKNLIIDN